MKPTTQQPYPAYPGPQYPQYAPGYQPTPAVQIARPVQPAQPALAAPPAAPAPPTTSGPSTPAPAQEKSNGYVGQLRTLVKSSGIYALSSLAGPLTSLVLAPVLTHTLSRDEYGALSVLLAAISLIAGITQLGLGNAFFRAYGYDYESRRERLRVLSTLVGLLLAISIVATLAMSLGAAFIALLLFQSALLTAPVQAAALVVLLQNLSVPGLAWLRAENRPTLYATLSIANLLVGLVATLLFIGPLHLGMTGALLGTASGYAIVVFSMLPVILWEAGLTFDREMAGNMLSFGVPLVASFVSVWVLQLSDRYLLSRFGSLAETASYSIAYTLGNVLGVLVISPFNLAWPTTMFSVARRRDAPQIFRLIFRWFSVALLLAAFGLSLAGKFLLEVLFPDSYHGASPVISLVAMSMVFYGIYNVFNVGISIKRKTWYAVVLTAEAAIFNVVLNVLLIPLTGALGAAFSTLLAYAFLSFLAYLVNNQMYPVPFEIGFFLSALTIGIALYFIAAFLVQGLDPLSSAVLYGLIWLTYVVILLLLARLPLRQLARLRHSFPGRSVKRSL
ncbi:lipopolysaccharide biosynthesis protein [Thermogemmatispora carboxidivorans]|uniref:lipopolysaccharide biosynthesis protein n=1 Tax=Thermogemmatispora carboxidivorans TaxID=1382306 RepID=UPI00069937E7|nr:polysaccharide biosynthesis C-terminal domain-containing protein [Thermogemmatispora carboxidivorans]